MKRKVNAIWKGDGENGNGFLSAQSGGFDKMPYSFKTRFKNDDGNLGTNPEELIAAALSGCFNMKLSFVLNESNFNPEELNTDAVLVPGGFGERGIEGMILACKFSRENDIPYLGICLGMQVAIIEYARNVLKLKGANSTEFNQNTKHPVIGLITEWSDISGKKETRSKDSDLGGTMRLGGQLCMLKKKSNSYKMYKKQEIIERHRHRYEVNPKYKNEMIKKGLDVVGTSIDGKLVEMIEIPSHKWFLACQFHPEFTSNPRDGHPIFNSYIKSTISK